jgi:SOS-response transcriptional repressor LexA
MNNTLITRLQDGETVSLRPHGNSMTPLIYSGQLVTLEPIDDLSVLSIGDIVFCKVNGKKFIHKITKIGPDGRFMISNNHGHDNGWTKTIYGRVIKIEN